MAGLVETFAKTLDWNIRRCNVIVEGTSDVSLLWHANALHFERHGSVILGDEISVVAAGKGNDGGVEGLNRRLHAITQMADADRGPDGARRFRFVGLYDNDRAGRRGVDALCNFDRRFLRCGDLFLLNPIMPLSNGADPRDLARRFESENAPYRGIDWEIEDLLSDRILEVFDQKHPGGVQDVHEQSGKRHWEFTREGKHQLHSFVRENATFEDVSEVVRLIRSLRDYLRLKIEHVRF